MFYDAFVAACEEVGVAPTTLLKQLGLGKSGAQNWKNGMEPTNRIKKLIADYFGVSVSDLVAGKIKKPSADDGEELSDEEKTLLAMYRDVPEDQRKMVYAMIESALKSQGLL